MLDFDQFCRMKSLSDVNISRCFRGYQYGIAKYTTAGKGSFFVNLKPIKSSKGNDEKNAFSKMHNFVNLHGRGSKIEQATPFLISHY